MIYILLSVFTVPACEEIYTPVLENVKKILVVEAILISNQKTNYIRLSESKEFNDESKNYDPVTGAIVYLVDKNDVKTQCREDSPGKYLVDYQLQSGEKYYLSIEAGGETYQSDWQEVPDKPAMDSIYPEFGTRTLTSGTENSTENIVTEDGFRVYTDIDSKGQLNYYRFSARKVVQYIDFHGPVYYWKSYYPTGLFNLAAPPEYSTVKNITKHRLEFFEKDYYKYFADTLTFAGWIYCVYQYGLNENTYNYYSDLNSQLDTQGKIFDPVYIQARGNISCTSSPGKAVLGNFEISSFSETRYFLSYYRAPGYDSVMVFRKIPYFYDIPEEGGTIFSPPDFWEKPTRPYPNE